MSVFFPLYLRLAAFGLFLLSFPLPGRRFFFCPTRPVFLAPSEGAEVALHGGGVI